MPKLNKLTTPSFQKSLQTLRSHPEMKASLAWKALPSVKAIREAQENFDALRLELCKKLSRKDDEGNPVMIPTPNGLFQYIFEPEVQKQFNDELEALGEADVELPPPVLAVSSILDINLSIDDLDNLVGVVLLADEKI